MKKQPQQPVSGPKIGPLLACYLAEVVNHYTESFNTLPSTRYNYVGLFYVVDSYIFYLDIFYSGGYLVMYDKKHYHAIR